MRLTYGRSERGQGRNGGCVKVTRAEDLQRLNQLITSRARRAPTFLFATEALGQAPHPPTHQALAADPGGRRLGQKNLAGWPKMSIAIASDSSPSMACRKESNTHEFTWYDNGPWKAPSSTGGNRPRQLPLPA